MPLRMSASRLAIALAVSTSAAAGMAWAGDDASSRPIKPITDCMDPGRVRAWSNQGDRVVVDAGRRQYVIELAHGCPELDLNPFLGFISHNPSGRICGDVGDRLVPHGAHASVRRQCSIRGMRMIDRAEYASMMSTADAVAADR